MQCSRTLMDTHSGPLGADLPLATDLQLTRDCGLGPFQVLTMTHVNIECAVGVNLAAQNLPVLHAQTTGFTAF